MLESWRSRLWGSQALRESQGVLCCGMSRSSMGMSRQEVPRLASAHALAGLLVK